MYIHLRFSSEKEESVMMFNYGFVSVADVLRKAKKRYGKKTCLVLLDSDNICLKESTFVQKGRSYRVKRL